MAELKRGDVIRNKITGQTGIFYSYYRPKENHDLIYILLPMYYTPQITSISTYEATGEHIDIFEKIKQGDSAPENEQVRMAQDLKNVDDYLSGHEDYEELEYDPDDGRILIDLNDFLALARSEASSKNTLNYILRALRLGVEPSAILAIFDENTGYSIEDLLMKPESPFYIPNNDEENTT